MFRPPYDDSFKVSALEMLSAAGYPAQRGALIGVSRALGVPTATLRRWALAMPGETSSIALRPTGFGPLSLTSPALPDAVRAELLATLASMAAARSDATYKELSAGFAVLAEKLRQLEPAPEGPSDSSPGEAHDRLSRLVGVADTPASDQPSVISFTG